MDNEKFPAEDKNPFEDLFNQLGDLLKFVQEHGHIPVDESKVTPDILQKLEKLENDVKNLKQLSDQIVALSNVSREEIKKRLAGVSDEISPHGKRLLDQGEKLKSEIIKTMDRLNVTTERPPEESLPAATQKEEVHPPSKKTVAKRRRKFRGFGEGDWKPL